VSASSGFAQELTALRYEASESPKSLHISFAEAGVTLPPPTCDEEGLQSVESAYQTHYRELPEPQLVERLMGLFLGEVAVRRHGAQWTTYQGSYHTSGPFVVELPDGGRFLDPLLFCTGLTRKSRLIGAKESTSLRQFLADRDQRCFP
jgi:hypothetical protein